MIKKAFIITASIFVLAACGTKVDEQEVLEIEENNELLQQQYDEAVTELETLNNASNEEDTSEEEVQPIEIVTSNTLTMNYLETVFTQDSGESYKVNTVDIQTASKEEAMQQILSIALAPFVVEKAELKDEKTANIYFEQASLDGGNLTSSFQTGDFFGKLHYVMAKNFPEIESYYLVTDGGPVVISEMGEMLEAIENTPDGLRPTYIQIKE